MNKIPIFDILHKITDNDAVPDMKTLYISESETREIVTHRYELPKPTLPFYDQKCQISYDFPENHNGYVDAYPNYITMEEIQILFPNCISLELGSPVDMSELSNFSKLQTLTLHSSDQENINGIEFLSSLQYLTFGPTIKSTPPHFPPTSLKDLSLLNFLNLKHLFIESDCIEDLGYLNIETLESLSLECKSLKSLKGLKVPNLKEIYINMFQYGLLLSLDIPDGCNIYLSDQDNIREQMKNGKIVLSIYKIVEEMFPQSRVGFAFSL
jgi:hypothetical protein